MPFSVNKVGPQSIVASGSVAANYAVLHNPNAASCVFQLSGTWTATVTFEATVNGTDFVAISATNANTGASATTATANGIYVLNVSSLLQARVRCSAFTSGTIVVSGLMGEGAPPSAVTVGSVTADTELAAASAGSDAFANPTTAPVHALNYGWNGATWDRIGDHNGASDARGTATLGLQTESYLYGFNGTNWDRLRVDANKLLRTTAVLAGGSVSAKTNVSASATEVSLLASTAGRLGATVFNDGSAVLYISLGTVAASTTSYTAQVTANGYYEVPFGYTGAIRGIWSAAAGSARITEITV